MPEIDKMKKQYAALRGQNPRGRYASNPRWLKTEIKRMDQVLKMVVRAHMTHENKRNDPMPRLREEAEKYGLHPDERELGSRAVKFYRALQKPRRARRPTAGSKNKKRKTRTKFADCTGDEDCEGGFKCSKQNVCEKVRYYT